jgi:DNA invertase Pin-like site-specific DNA recombinase
VWSAGRALIRSARVRPRLIRPAGCDVIRSEKRSGTTTAGRAELETVPQFLRPGAVLTVTKLDRLACSLRDLQNIAHALEAKGAALKVLDQQVDTTTAAGKCFFGMLGAFAEFETALRKERQLEGISKAKAAEVYKGRKPSVDVAQVRALKAQGRRAVCYRKTPRCWPCERLQGIGGLTDVDLQERLNRNLDGH